MLLKSNKSAISTIIFLTFTLIFASSCSATSSTTSSNKSHFSNTQLALMAAGAVGALGAIAAIFLGGSSSSGNNDKQAAPAPLPAGISSVDPANAATGVALNKNIVVIFTKQMNPATLNTKTFFLKTQADGVLVPGAVTYSGVVARFIPQSTLAINTPYVVTLTTAIKDTAGNSLATNYTWVFTTDAPVNTETPNLKDPVIETSELKNSIIETPESRNPIIETPELKKVAASSENKVVEALSLGKSITRFFAKTCLSAAKPPEISKTDPVKAATNVEIDADIKITFTNKMQSKTLNTNTFTLSRADGTLVAGSVEYDAATNTATFITADFLKYGSTYTASITTDALDDANNSLSEKYTWNFTTETDELPVAPQIQNIEPAKDSININIDDYITISFDRPMDQTTLNTDTVVVKTKDGIKVSGSMVKNLDSSAAFIPEELLESTQYTVTITKEVKDAAGKSLADDYSWVFTTGA